MKIVITDRAAAVAIIYTLVIAIVVFHQMIYAYKELKNHKMKNTKIFLALISLVILASCSQLFALPVPIDEAAATDSGIINKTFDLVKNMDPINWGLIAISLIFANWWRIGRTKLKQAGEFFLKAYEYTDDKVLDKTEREDLLNRVWELINKKRYVTPPKQPVSKKDV